MIDKKDKKILNLMIQNPELSQKKIANEMNITPPAVHNRILKMKEKGILLGTAPKIALDKVGYDLTVVINVKVKNGKLKATEQMLSKDPNVCICYRISGVYDIMVIAKFHNTNELDAWTNKMLAESTSIDRTNTSIVFTKGKEQLTPSEFK